MKNKSSIPEGVIESDKNSFQLKTLDALFERLFRAIAIVSTLLIAGLMVFLVFSRYVMGWSIIGLNEVIMLAAIWLYMSGSIIASRRNEHLAVDLIQQKISSPFWQAVHFRVISMVTLLTCVFFMWWSYKMLGWSLKRPQSTSALDLPLLIPQSAIIFASFFSFIYSLRDLIRGKPYTTVNQLKE